MRGSYFQHLEPQIFGVELETTVWSTPASAAQSTACVEGTAAKFN